MGILQETKITERSLHPHVGRLPRRRDRSTEPTPRQDRIVLQGGSGFCSGGGSAVRAERSKFGTYNIRNGRNGGLEAALRGMDQANLDMRILQETKITDGVGDLCLSY